MKVPLTYEQSLAIFELTFDEGWDGKDDFARAFKAGWDAHEMGNAWTGPDPFPYAGSTE